MTNNLNSKSNLDTEQLAALGAELALRQVQNLLLQKDLKQDRVAEPGSPAFALVTQGEMLLTSLRAAQLPIPA